jgi:serine/threonine protein kinase
LFALQNSSEVIAKIFTLFGRPEDEVIEKWQGLPYYYDIVTEELKDIVRQSKGQTIDKEFESFHPLAVDLMKRLMNLDPHKRINAKDAMNHPFFSIGNSPKIPPSSKVAPLLKSL